MVEKQKVYIKGSAERGDEVIKLLEDLGGNNLYNYCGENEDAYYFINPEGVIDFAFISGSAIWPFIKEFYKEIKLSKWKPEYRGRYYYIDSTGEITEIGWYSTEFNESHYKFGNCFRTPEEAKAARDNVKEMLKE